MLHPSTRAGEGCATIDARASPRQRGPWPGGVTGAWLLGVAAGAAYSGSRGGGDLRRRRRDRGVRRPRRGSLRARLLGGGAREQRDPWRRKLPDRDRADPLVRTNNRARSEPRQEPSGRHRLAAGAGHARAARAVSGPSVLWAPVSLGDHPAHPWARAAGLGLVGGGCRAAYCGSRGGVTGALGDALLEWSAWGAAPSVRGYRVAAARAAPDGRAPVARPVGSGAATRPA
jgi:hypothetical protein